MSERSSADERIIKAAEEWYAAGADVVSPDGRAYRAIRELRRAVIASFAVESAPPEIDPELRALGLAEYAADDMEYPTRSGYRATCVCGEPILLVEDPRAGDGSRQWVAGFGLGRSATCAGAGHPFPEGVFHHPR